MNEINYDEAHRLVDKDVALAELDAAPGEQLAPVFNEGGEVIGYVQTDEDVASEPTVH